MRGSETVLIVEDERDVRDLASEALEGYGYNVLGAANGREALTLAEQHAAPIDLLLTDVVMPGMNGKVLADQLRRQRPTIKTVFMSGYSDDVISESDLAKGGEAYLQKPFAPQDLASKVRETLGIGSLPKTVLVVDDEDSIRGLFQELLTAEGYRVLVASDGRQACDLLRRGLDLDLVITDLVMPNQEGIETIQALRQQFPKVKIIAISGAFGGQFLSTARLLGADATLMKPVSPNQLRGTVAEVLSRG